MTDIRQLMASPRATMFVIFDGCPLTGLVSLVVVGLLTVFFVASTSSTACSLDIVADGKGVTPPACGGMA